jgi:hypothetical protein
LRKAISILEEDQSSGALRTLLFNFAVKSFHALNSVSTFVWSEKARRIPDGLNSQLVGTFPAVVSGEDGFETCAFFVRSGREELFKAKLRRRSTRCFIKPQFVKTPQGPLLVAYCMASARVEGQEPFISETAIFPRLASMPSHKEIFEMLKSKNEAYLVICDEKGRCIFNSRARILEEWKSELANNSGAFDQGQQISDEKAAIMSLYWYQERYHPSSGLFEVKH